MLRAERLINADLRAAIRHAARFFPGFTVAELAEAVARQPSRVDIRSLEPVVYGRWDALRSLGLVPAGATVPRDAVCFGLLEKELSSQ
jgi:hypothetical protein